MINYMLTLLQWVYLNSAWSDQRRRMGSYMAYTPRSCDHR